LLPAIRLVEDAFFTPVSNPPWRRKTAKTIFRAFFVFFLAGIAIIGSKSLDNFVSLIGAVCGMPLAFVFPAVCHYHLVATNQPMQRLLDVFLITLGTISMFIVTAVNVKAWIMLGE